MFFQAEEKDDADTDDAESGSSMLAECAIFSLYFLAVEVLRGKRY